MKCNETRSWSPNQSKYLAFYIAVHGSLWKTRHELTWTALTTRSKVTKFQKGLSLSPLVQRSRSSEVTELLTSASCCCFWLKTWLTVSQSEKQPPLCPQANFVQVCPMSSRNPFFSLMWLPGSGLSLSCGQGEANHSAAWEKSVLLAESRLVNIAKQVWDEDVLQEWGPCFELGRGLKYTPQQGQKHLLGFFWCRRIAERQRVLTALQACIFPLNTFTARIWKAEAGRATNPTWLFSKIPLKFPLYDSVSLTEEKKQGPRYKSFTRRPFCELGRRRPWRSSPLLLPFANPLCLSHCCFPFWTMQQMAAVGF